ncbi:MAG: type II toxin-antitoxin system RelE/ParE family toxin [Wolbachia endosymbiont of Penenirmus auritus]|nr:type II toxin-antitoxin system RelE/ParE family toxin [Wolbachia endosymbiont of Penenirmus auritus]
MGYTIIYLDNVLEKDLPSLPKTVRKRIIKAINERLTVDPINLGKTLDHSLKGYKGLRVGDYRVLYDVNTSKYEVTIVTVGHRGTIYEKAKKILNIH